MYITTKNLGGFMKIGDFLISDLKTIEKADFSNPPFTSQKQLDDYVWARQMPQRSKWYGFDLATGKHKGINRYFDDNGNQTLYEKKAIPSVLELVNLQTATQKKSKTFEEVKNKFKQCLHFEYDNLKAGRFNIERDYIPFIAIEIQYAALCEEMTMRIASNLYAFFPDKDSQGNSLAAKFLKTHMGHIQLAVENGVEDVIVNEQDTNLKNSMLIALAKTPEEILDLTKRITNLYNPFYVFNCLNNPNTPKEVLWNIENTLKSNIWKELRTQAEQQNAMEFLHLHNNYSKFSGQSILDKLKAS